MPVTRNGETRTMSKPDRRITDFVCAATKMDRDQTVRAACRLVAKDRDAAIAMRAALGDALEVTS